ncbi:profilin [Fimicolochytrium jonesii]|uniref:profilin n=1 Tax=Fimicolochytrium jonesii TaxID=1396493 RepID=UPI0022FE92E4|nr:profilin [Fimicolochytrium jonesii]KAI8819382.1 profilin [Fimicolochytrium jonesii]
MNSLLEEALLATQHIQHGAILRIKDGAIKGRSPQFSMSPSDLSLIQHAFEKPGEARTMDTGLTLGEEEYHIIRADRMAVYGKHKSNGIIICRTHQFYILGTYENGMHASIAVEAVEKLGMSRAAFSGATGIEGFVCLSVSGFLYVSGLFTEEEQVISIPLERSCHIWKAAGQLSTFPFGCLLAASDTPPPPRHTRIPMMYEIDMNCAIPPMNMLLKRSEH